MLVIPLFLSHKVVYISGVPAALSLSLLLPAGAEDGLPQNGGLSRTFHRLKMAPEWNKERGGGGGGTKG